MATTDRAPLGWKRTTFVVAVCGFVPFLWNAAFDDWPSVRRWVIFIAGLVVIAVGSSAIETFVARKRAGVSETG
jgi:hypothetical protein